MKRTMLLCVLLAGLALAGCSAETQTTPATTETAVPPAAQEVQEMPSAAEQVPAVQETAAPAVQETAAPAVQETAAPAVQETAAPAVQETAASAVQETDAPAAARTFRPGIWLGVGYEDGVRTDRYFCFGEDMGGSFLEQESGMGVGFTCEIAGTSANFHIGDVESQTTVEITWRSDTEAQLVWTDYGYAETLTYLAAGDFRSFTFYSNEELAEMALNYYEAANAYRPGAADAAIDEDGTVVIRFYDSFADHDATSDWYRIDRYTARGTDLMEEPVDLTAAPRG